MYSMPNDTVAEQLLLANIKQHMPELEALLQQAQSHWGYEDYVYRYYHQSWKVFGVQSTTTQIVKTFRELLPNVELNGRFLAIIHEGTGKQFTDETNKNWDAITRP